MASMHARISDTPLAVRARERYNLPSPSPSMRCAMPMATAACSYAIVSSAAPASPLAAGSTARSRSFAAAITKRRLVTGMRTAMRMRGAAPRAPATSPCSHAAGPLQQGSRNGLGKIEERSRNGLPCGRASCRLHAASSRAGLHAGLLARPQSGDGAAPVLRRLAASAASGLGPAAGLARSLDERGDTRGRLGTRGRQRCSTYARHTLTSRKASGTSTDTVVGAYDGA
mmetsp:Transcript_3866/g.12067  ORF Transcript_3866/g.12067 Transcript_3866/m.12067 type:complete len:228 (-) Transcript_3866:1792-2475(-)